MWKYIKHRNVASVYNLNSESHERKCIPKCTEFLPQPNWTRSDPKFKRFSNYLVKLLPKKFNY